MGGERLENLDYADVHLRASGNHRAPRYPNLRLPPVTIAFWRFTLGMGIGGVYPLSAADSYENEDKSDSMSKSDDPPEKQAVMRVAWTLFWQQPGQISVYFVALILLSWFGHNQFRLQLRLLMALGALPAILVLPAALLDEEESRDSQKK